MRFKTIKIENFFSYYGLKHFDFANSDKPVHLIIGENGFGKTSFINSVKIAFHGINRDILSIGNQTLTKQDFILGNNLKNFSGILNRQAKQEGENTAKVTITIDDDDVLVVERTFTINSNNYAETLKIYDEEGNILAEGDDAQDIVNAKISPTMARFFFFDGEKIQTIADFSHEEFTQMLEDVLELDIYDQMAKDSEALIRKVNKSELDQDLQQQVVEKESALEELRAEIDTIKELFQHEKKEILSELQSKKREIDTKLKKLQSQHKKPLEKARTQLELLKEQRKNFVLALKQAVLVQLPLLLNSSLREKISNDIDQHYRGKVQIDQNVLSEKKKQFLDLLAVSDKESVSNTFDAVFQSSTEDQSVSFADPHKVEKQFDALPDINLPELLEALSTNIKEVRECEMEIIELEHKIADDKKEYEHDFKALKDVTETIIRQEVKCEALEEKISTLETEEKTIKSELAKLTIQEHQNGLANEKINTLKSIISVSSVIKKKIKSDKRENLEKSINVKFQQLRKEGYEASKIVLDDDFNINIYDANGHPMDILSSSSGQKQIIATALIWGISEYIGEDIPMIIDTPLGRLDDKNQSLILNEFYPNVSKQVIILPTPSELKHEGFKKLTEHVSQTFLLSNGGSATSVEEIKTSQVINNAIDKQVLESAS